MENYEKNTGDIRKDEKGQYITIAQIRQIIREELGELKIYVVESEITQAQNKIKAIVEQASF